MVKAVIDTNILLVSVSKHSPYHWVFHRLLNGEYTLCVTSDILLEYEEIVGKEMGAEVAENLMQTLDNLPNVELITKYFCWNLIKEDADDNKFVDCVVSSSAACLVSHDAHFKVLKKINFSKINVFSLEEFKKILMRNDD